jgi:nicotinamidase-related amidase
MRELAVPAHFDSARVGEVYRVDYQAVAAQALADATRMSIRPAAEDRPRICLLVIDPQNTFCIPGFELFVAGAVEDNQRLIRFLYRNLERISTVTATMDTHLAMQIFHPQFWVGRDGAHPAPNTAIARADVEAGVWRVNPAVAGALGQEPGFLERYARHYVTSLEQEGKYALTVWPYHAMLGGIGHAVVSALEEVIFYHAIARSAPSTFVMKGSNPLTENYSAMRPEVLEGPDRADIGAQQNQRLFAELMQYDAIIVAGQAKSHCVAWTVDDLLAGIRSVDPALAGKVYLLEDATSPVAVPGVVDFSEPAAAAFRRFAEAGMHLVRTDQPMAEWPGTALHRVG